MTFHRRLSNKTDPINKNTTDGSGTGTSGAVLCPRTHVHPSHAPSLSTRAPAPLPEPLQALPSPLRQYFHQSFPLFPTPASYNSSYSIPETRSPKEKCTVSSRNGVSISSSRSASSPVIVPV